MNTKYVVGGIVIILLVLGWYVVEKDDHHHDEHHDESAHEHAMLEAREPVRADGTFTIATSFYPLQFALERIVGDLGTVVNVGEGRDPHDFRPSTQDVLTMQRADVVVLQGAEFEPWGDDIMERLHADGVPVVVATADITLHEGGHHGDHADEHEHDHDHGHEHEDEHGDEGEHAHEEEEGHEDAHHHGAFDPHTWLDPVLFSETVTHLGEAMATLDPDNAATYEANAALFQSELATLHSEYENRLASCVLDEVITSHDAFGYLGERYDFEIHTIAGFSTQDLPSATTLASLREEAEEGIGAILLEENSVASYGETLARETGLDTLSINPIAYVIPMGEDYLTLMRANLDTFATALNCNE